MIDDYLFKNVLLLTDFSDYSRNAIMYTINALGNRSNYKLLNCYFCRTSASTFIDINEKVYEESTYLLKEEKMWIENQFPEFQLDIEMVSKFGRPADVVKEDLLNDIDLVVVGGKGGGKLERFFAGSVTKGLIPNLDVPLLMVPIGADYHSIEKATLANDLKYMSKDSNMAVIRALKGHFNCEITSLSIRPKGWEPNPVEMRLLDRLNERKFIQNNYIVEDDNTSSALITFCFDHQVDLLIVISRKRGFFQRIFGNSISRELMNQAIMPVLVL